jgi:hypothetical protein
MNNDFYVKREHPTPVLEDASPENIVTKKRAYALSSPHISSGLTH